MHNLLITLAVLASHPPPLADLSPARVATEYANGMTNTNDANDTGQFKAFEHQRQDDLGAIGTPTKNQGGDTGNFCGDIIDTDAKATGQEPRWTDEPRDPGSTVGGQVSNAFCDVNVTYSAPRWRDLQRRSSN